MPAEKTHPRAQLEAVDVAVVGAGPAGLAAAGAAAAAGASVLLLDASAREGGQYWRHRPEDVAAEAARPAWHHGWSTFLSLRERVDTARRHGRLTHLQSTQVISIDVHEDAGDFTLHTAATPESQGPAGLRAVHAHTVVLATGAYDRHLPVPGWTLPGVMAAGGIQAFIKTQGVAPGRRVLLAGTGPFLLAAAASVLRSGAEVAAVCESTDLTGWAPGGATAALVPSKGAEGAEYAALLARHRVPYRLRRVVTRILGAGRVEAVATAAVDRSGTLIPETEEVYEDVDVVGLGWGFAPQTELLLQTAARTRLDADGSLVGVVDARQESSVPGLFLAGELTGVTGAVGAVAEGRIAGAAAAGRASTGPATARARTAAWADRAARTRHRLFARAMHTAHPVPEGWQSWMSEDTTVCRCEEVPYGEVLDARDGLHLPDPRSLKGQTRAGMGMCQGRMCGFAMTCLTAGTDPAGPLRAEHARQVGVRPLSSPVALGAFLTSDDEPDRPRP
ncbi:FAD/NAD(P)-dependent oxidoreductase [Micrococcus yunnanensis]|uniref:FAD/NAD(P)-dependent oxidoreductase n=1 Tax=Micrococcus yunnanensis TaxID=566027 RepID=UPI00178A4715|nr:NAD(P)/FAD-dependent oxidoreductase [Micrococcus yunnanensis]MBE1539895.1 thioredoxin reductase [Micrococcus yunnanensis]